MATTKVTAKTKLFNHFADAGWEQDPRAFRVRDNTWRGTDLPRVRDNTTMIKPAKHGGLWRVKLGFNRVSTGWASSREGDTIKEIDIFHVPEGFVYEYDAETKLDRSDYVKVAHLERVNTEWKHSNVWDALNDGTRKLRDMAELLATNPDEVVWAAKEADHHREVAERAERAEQKARIEAEMAPLQGVALGDGEHRFNSPFRVVGRRLESVAGKLAKADGTTDVPELIAKAQAELEALIVGLTPEGAQRLVNAWDQARESATFDRSNPVVVELDL